MVDDRIERLAGMAGLVLADPVVDDDRVVNAEADDRQHGRHEERVYLDPEDGPHDREAAHHHDDVVKQGRQRRGAELDALETDADPDQDAERAEEDEQYGLLDQLALTIGPTVVSWRVQEMGPSLGSAWRASAMPASLPSVGSCSGQDLPF